METVQSEILVLKVIFAQWPRLLCCTFFFQAGNKYCYTCTCTEHWQGEVWHSHGHEPLWHWSTVTLGTSYCKQLRRWVGFTDGQTSLGTAQQCADRPHHYNGCSSNTVLVSSGDKQWCPCVLGFEVPTTDQQYTTSNRWAVKLFIFFNKIAPIGGNTIRFA